MASHSFNLSSALHAARHATGGADPITPESIGAVAAANQVYTTLYVNSDLLAASASAVSSWFDFQTLQITTLLITHTRVGGVYSFEVDWSTDGINVAVTEEIQGAGANNTSLAKTIASRYGRMRIKNTDLAAAFTDHHTIVVGR